MLRGAPGAATIGFVVEAISDERVAAVLRVFVRGCGAMLPRLREGDEPVDLAGAAADREVDRRLLDRVRHRLRQVRVPGSDAWSRMDVEDRSIWWVNRVGRLTALAASVTGLAGALGDRLPLQDILGASGQGLLLCAIATEHGVEDRATRVQLLARVLFDRRLDPAVAAGTGDDAADDAEVAALTGAAPPAMGRRFRLTTAAKWLWRQGRLLYAISGELEKRPHGRFYHRALGMLPIVGMLGDYLGERSALKRAAKAADRWLHRYAGR